MRITWYAALIAAALFVAPVAGVNFVVDNHNLLRNSLDSKSLKNFVAAMRKAEIGVPYTLNDRSVKLLVAIDSKASCLAIGSSHIMTLRKGINPDLDRACATIDNAGVTGASFEDLVTFMHVAVANPNVRHLIVGVDLWSLTRNSRTNWKRNSKELFAAREAFGLSRTPYDSQSANLEEDWITQLFSVSYFNVNYKFLKRVWAGKATLSYDSRSLTEEELKTELTLRPDASLSYPAEYKPAPAETELTPTDQWVVPPFVDQSVVEEWRAVIKGIRAAGKDITLVETPYHPFVVGSCPKPRICEAMPIVDATVRKLGQETSVAVLGSYDPRRLGLTGEDFIDFQHMRGATGWPKIGAQADAN